MTIWIKEGVIGDICPELKKEEGRIIKYYEKSGAKDFFITSRRESNHQPGSFHSIGRAEDFSKQNILFELLKNYISPGFDLINEKDHYHLEYDPKLKNRSIDGVAIKALIWEIIKEINERKK